MSYLPVVAWSTNIRDVVMIDSTTYTVLVSPLNVNEPGAAEAIKEVGFYIKDFVGNTYEIIEVNVGGDTNRVKISDSYEIGVGPQSGQHGFVYQSVGDGDAPFIAPIRHNRIDKSALDFSRSTELDILWKNLFHIDQTNRQVIVNGIPRFEEGIEAKFVDFDRINLNIPEHKEGRVFYDPTKRALSVYNDIPGITHNLGREFLKRTRRSGTALTPILNGQIVYVNNVDGDLPTIELARADRYNTSRIIGVATHDIGIGEEGDITVLGDVSDLDMTGCTSGEVVYLSPTVAGAHTHIRPTGGNYVVVVGIAQKVGLNGSLFVYPRASEYTDETIRPTGFSSFLDGVDTTLSFNEATRTLTIAPIGDSFYFYQDGEKWIMDSAKSIQIPDSEGMHIIYFNNGVLYSTQNPSISQMTDIIENRVITAAVYWNADDNEALCISNERHTFHWPKWLHYYIHTTRGTQYNSGLGLHSMVFDGGSLDSNAQFGVDAGAIADEDVITSSPYMPSTQGLPIYYRIGNPGVWRRIVRPGYSFTNNTTTGLVQYNKNTAGTWSIESMTNNYYRLVHIFACSDIRDNNKVVAFSGVNEYSAVSIAEAAVGNEITSIYSGNLPFAEMKHIATTILQTKNSFSNSVRAAYVKTVSGFDYLDFRKTSTVPSAGGGTGGVTTLLALTDGPDTYTGHSKQFIKVNAGETGFEFEGLLKSEIEAVFTGNIITHTHNLLTQPDGTNPFVYTDNSGTLHIDGNIVQNGSAYETHAEQVFTKNNFITLRDGAIAGLAIGEYTGLVAKLYDGVNDGQLVFDRDGTARVGDVGSLQPIATRIESPVNGYFAYWEGSNVRLNFKQIYTSDISGLQGLLDGKQDLLVSGINIKTINGNSLLGSGDISIEGGTGAGIPTSNTFIASAGQTTFTTSQSYAIGSTYVFYNGSKLAPSEYDASNGTTIVLNTAARLNDIIEVTYGNTASGTALTSVILNTPIGLIASLTVLDGVESLGLQYEDGYSIPTSSLQSNWSTAYDSRISSFSTVGNSGAASLLNNALNIPEYTLAGLGGQASSANLTSLSGLTYANTSFVKMLSANTFALDSNSYSLSNHVHAESVITFTDTTVNNSTSSQHGYLPKLSNIATQFLNGQGGWTVPIKYSTKSIAISSPVGTESITLGYFKDASTITDAFEVVAGASPSVSYQISFASTRTGSATTMYSSPRGVTSTSGATTTTFANAVIPAGSWVWITLSSLTGTVTELSITLRYSF